MKLKPKRSDIPVAKIMRASRSSYRYFVVIRNGEDWRGFDSLDLVCDLMGLDPKLTERFLDEKGYYSGYEFTVFRYVPETRNKHRGIFL